MEILARAVGRRKEAVAQVQLVRGNGQFIINDKPAQTYLQNNSCSLICIKSPLQAALSLFSNNPPQLQTNTPLTHTPNNGRGESTSLVVEGLQPITTKVLNERRETLSPQNALENLETYSQKPNNSVEEHPGQGSNENSQLPISNTNYLDQMQAVPPSDLSNNGPLTKNNGVSLGAQGEVLPSFASQGEIDIIIKVKGGGLIGQAEAIKLGVARAFCIMENSSGGALLRKILKTKGYLTQDSRVKERRKYGLKKARKASQYHKR